MPMQGGEPGRGIHSKKLLGSSVGRGFQGGEGTTDTPASHHGEQGRVPTGGAGLSIASAPPGPRVKGEKPPVKEPRGKAKGQHPDPPPPEHDFLGCMSK